MKITKNTIRSFRKDKSLSRQELGAKIGFSKASVKAWEQGLKISPRAKLLLEQLMSNGQHN